MVLFFLFQIWKKPENVEFDKILLGKKKKLNQEVI